MLENQSPAQAPTQETKKTEAAKKVQAAEAQVAIYNEDDLSHLLFTGSNFESVTTNHHNHLHHHHHQDGTLTPLTVPASSGTHTPLFSDHDESDSESAVLEDWESPAEGDLEVPRSPTSRRRGGTMCSTDDDFAWPVFLGRQADELASRRSSVSSTSSSTEETKNRVPVEHHVECIEGPLMALWPSAIETLDFEAPFYE